MNVRLLLYPRTAVTSDTAITGKTPDRLEFGNERYRDNSVREFTVC